MTQAKPVVLVTGATGNLGRSVVTALATRYHVVGLDREAADIGAPVVNVDFTSAGSIDGAMEEIRSIAGDRIASVIHLAAFFDFSGEDHPLYEDLNVAGTVRLLEALGTFHVEQFLYSSTMLVHRPGKPGDVIDETQPIDPQWAYPESKAAAEAAIAHSHGRIPYVLLRLAGIYDEDTMVPTLAHQIARIYERDLQSHLYSGSTQAGQSMLHRDDMIDAIVRTVDRRATIPSGTALLIGEEEAPGYDELQDRIGSLIHGENDWPTIRVPAVAAAIGAWAQGAIEPIVPDALDGGEKPFIRPFMVRMASDHYVLNIERAATVLDWRPRRRLMDTLPEIVARLKRDPAGWYRANKVPLPDWVEQAATSLLDPERLRAKHEQRLREEHRRFRWTHFLNVGLGFLLATQPPAIAVSPPLLAMTEVLLGCALMILATLSLSWRLAWARYASGAIGLAIMAAPFVLWSPTAAAYLTDTIIGMLVIGLALGGRPEIGPSPIAAADLSDRPLGWSYNPSVWSQRVQIIGLAILGLCVSRYLAAYQLDHVQGVWEPFFDGAPDDPQNGTEEIITSSVAEAFPIPDAALGAFVYAIEVVTGVIGSTRRWRTMPWLVILFGILIVPLGVVSIGFIIIQPIVIGTWSTLTLIGAAAMLVQIPYSIDELAASIHFIMQRARAGRSWLRTLLFGDGNALADRSCQDQEDEFERPLGETLRDIFAGGVSLPWNLLLAAAIGVALMFSRPLLGTEGTMAHSDHLLGALALAIISIAAAELARILRYLLMPIAAAIAISPWLLDGGQASLIANGLAGVAMASLSIRRGPIRARYGTLDKLIR